MGEFANSHNTLIDAHKEQEDAMEQLKAKNKIADTEDRSRQNVKLRSVPESILKHSTEPICFQLNLGHVTIHS